MIVDPITLWKAIHGGDPAPDVIRLTAAVAIYSLAARLDGGAEIKAAAGHFLQKEFAGLEKGR
jgi:hypothetical protein